MKEETVQKAQKALARQRFRGDSKVKLGKNAWTMEGIFYGTII